MKKTEVYEHVTTYGFFYINQLKTMLRPSKTAIIPLLFAIFLSACSGSGEQAAADPLILHVQQHFAPDRRVAVFRVEASSGKENVVLRGETNLPEAKKALLDSLAARNFSVIDSIRVLPDTTVAGTPWGLVTLSAGNMRTKPDHAAEMASQLLMGTPVRILQQKNGWFLIQSPDNYIGWCESSILTPLTKTEWEAWKQGDRYIYLRKEGLLRERADETSAVVSDLVLGDMAIVTAKENDFLQVQLPDGRTGFIAENDCLSFSEWKSTTPEANQAIATAGLLKGSPYLWGGTSSKAVDCSGLMKAAWFSQGVILARDASQQARYGEMVTVDELLAFEPGDLLFFGRSKERISHVGMYIGNGKYIHSSGLVRVNSLYPLDPDYSEFNRNRLVSARRILNSMNTEGIIQVKNHPWYSD
jgi:SH3-like domain-containing protein